MKIGDRVHVNDQIENNCVRYGSNSTVYLPAGSIGTIKAFIDRDLKAAVEFDRKITVTSDGITHLTKNVIVPVKYLTRLKSAKASDPIEHGIQVHEKFDSILNRLDALEKKYDEKIKKKNQIIFDIETSGLNYISRVGRHYASGPVFQIIDHIGLIKHPRDIADIITINGMSSLRDLMNKCGISKSCVGNTDPTEISMKSEMISNYWSKQFEAMSEKIEDRVLACSLAMLVNKQEKKRSRRLLL